MKNFTKAMSLVVLCVMVLAILVACAPNSDPAKAVAALEKKGYSVAKVDAVLGVGGLTCTVMASKTITDKDGNKKLETVTIQYYQAAENAKTAYEKIKADDSDSDYAAKVSGKIIWYGTKTAVKDAG